jgi:hypothetical protein
VSLFPAGGDAAAEARIKARLAGAIARAAAGREGATAR